MAKGESTSGLGTGMGCVYILIAAGMTYAGFQASTWMGSIVLAVAVIIGLVMYAIAKALGGGSSSASGACQVCGNVIERKSFVWKFNGVQKTVCPSCNSSLRRKASKDALERMGL